ncbi:hypothetical protein Moror_2240 [Moniliophthora roreri MCA 2997]|uniref:Uncharacterized protein n=2 Tax=Moniliophthora roreri TaxID=221103 RepID=V2WP48_MONRO|nr:hypothetical protein Moror_2240 [Moniliophthora roreri MCA 2997]KAI3605742.1 hypothetical protein WG66_012027 [Moniliophthora roreri]
MTGSKSFFSTNLKRKRLADFCHLLGSSSSRSGREELKMIVEDATEDSNESRTSCSSLALTNESNGSGRMTPRLVDTWVSKEDEDILEPNSSLLCAPRPAPRPPTPSHSLASSPSPSRSPSPSLYASPYSTPSSSSTGLPLTPNSEDEFPVQSRRVRSIKPLTIVKRGPSPNIFLDTDDVDAKDSASFESPCSKLAGAVLSPSYLSFSDDEDDDDEEEDASDFEWYFNELSTLLTLRSAMPQHASIVGRTSKHSSRPESIYIPPSSFRTSKPLPKLPSNQLDPSYPRESIQTVHTLVKPPTPPPKEKATKRPVALPLRRPPPRISVPTPVGDESDSFMDMFSPISERVAEAQSARERSLSSEGTALLRELQFEVGIGEQTKLPASLPTSPSAEAHAFEEEEMEWNVPRAAQLRSRWSSSTIGTLYNEAQRSRSPIPTTITRFFGSPQKTRP